MNVRPASASAPASAASASASSSSAPDDRGGGCGDDARSLSTAFVEAVEEDARACLSAAADADLRPQYAVERGWFNRFLAYKDGGVVPPGTIRNAPLLVAADGGEDVAAMDVSPDPDRSEEDAERLRRMRRKKWQNREDKQREGGEARDPEETGSSAHGGTEDGLKGEPAGGDGGGSRPEQAGAALHSPPLLRPKLRHGKDYALVGERSWDALSTRFSCDAAVPLPCRFVGRNGGNENGSSGKAVVGGKIAVEAYPDGADLPAESRLVEIPPSGKWEYACGKPAVASAPPNAWGAKPSSFSTPADPVSIGERSSSFPDLGDDLFPSLERSHRPDGAVGPSSASVAAPVSPTIPSARSTPAVADDFPAQRAIVPFDEAKAKVGKWIANRGPPPEVEAEAEAVTPDEIGNVDDDLGGGGNNGGVAKRKRATGLGNLGNTCFMNSTLQCLAHTAPLRQYFVTGEYRNDLNSDNPLGTGGELASEFSDLLKEMWGRKKDVYPSSRRYSNSYDFSSVTYPRSFKHALGKHASQFVGYDQHDSQELAVYLLDALHEDTNRVTKKPYVEKPEQGEGETDDEAAKKAWDLHLQREDSRILQDFMGMVKSRLCCPTAGCGRVSTTFDPCMYLSVPIPGAMDRTLKVTFVPLRTDLPMADLTVKLNKTSTFSNLQRKVVALASECYGFTEGELLEEDVRIADVWSHEIYAFYGQNEEVGKIKENDVTYAYQLHPLSNVREDAALHRSRSNSTDSEDHAIHPEPAIGFALDVAARERLDRNDQWQRALEEYIVQPLSLYKVLNPEQSTHEERSDFNRKTNRFTRTCRKCSDGRPPPPTPPKKVMFADSSTSTPASDGDVVMGERVESPPSLHYLRHDSSGSHELLRSTIEEQVEMSSSFKNVRTPHDLAILEYCAYKFRGFIADVSDEDGAVVQVVFKKSTKNSAGFQVKTRASARTVGNPIVMRLSPKLTVSDFRREIGKRISKALTVDQTRNGHASAAVAKGSGGDSSGLLAGKNGAVPNNPLFPEASPETLIMRQIALSYESKVAVIKKYNASNSMGSVTFDRQPDDRIQSFAKPSDEEEQKKVTKVVGDGGKIFLGWPIHLNDVLDEDALEVKEDFLSEEQSHEKKSENVATVKDCISKYCQVEQLEESEMWYCSQCKDHVQAWKQFHLYRTPPILVVHLKRFHFSSTSHRRDKIDILVDFPLVGLDLNEMVMHSEDGQPPIYDCYAVSNHFGGLGGGHYTAYAKGDDGAWWYFDDSHVSSVADEKEVISNAAYCLYYKRRDVVFDAAADDIMTPAAESDKELALVDPASDDMRTMNVDDTSPCASPVVSFTEEDQTDDMDGDCATPLISNDEKDSDNYTFLEI